MDSTESAKIDELTLRVQRLIAKNQEAIAEFDDEYTPISQAGGEVSSDMEDVDPAELFS